ncbi:MAG TPA: DUF1192 domain-containing protein [Caulobacteraceae bacterium]|jgi:uncharacterized small protein (DUF1192 family)|nr:DUF1192 domain-containing protein [Caulobacteraceae bacterium]
MAQEDADPIRRARGWAVAELAREDLDLFSVADLEERIEALDAEIARCKAQMERKRAGRAAADAFFSKPS